MFAGFSIALDFSFDIPSRVGINENFLVKVNANSNESYDVKIVANDVDKKILSEIDNGGWKSSYYYVKNVFPQKNEFTVRMISGSGSNDICVRMRKSGGTAYDEVCKKIEIISGNNNVNDKDESDEEDKTATEVHKDNSVDETDKKVSDNAGSDETKINDTGTDKGLLIDNTKNNSLNKNEVLQSEQQVQKIMLNPYAIREPEAIRYTSGKEKSGVIMIYSFVLFCIAIFVLILLRKL